MFRAFIARTLTRRPPEETPSLVILKWNSRLLRPLTLTSHIRIPVTSLKTIEKTFSSEEIKKLTVDVKETEFFVFEGQEPLILFLSFFVLMFNFQVYLVLATTFILCIHCYFQPYEETRANISEMIFTVCVIWTGCRSIHA